MSIIAKATTSTVQVLIQEDLGNGNGAPVLQRFPTTIAPRVGETIAVQDREYEVKHVSHHFHVTEENRHIVWVDVKRTK